MDQLKQAALALSIFAGFHDALTLRIPNWLCFPGIILGLTAQLYWGGSSDFWQGVAGVVVGFGLFFPLFFFRIMGGGDVKLLMLIGAFTAPIFTLRVAVASILIGGLYALVDTLLKGRLLHVLSVLRGLLQGWLVRSQAKDLLDKDRKFSFGIAMAVGFAVVLILEQRGVLQ